MVPIIQVYNEKVIYVFKAKCEDCFRKCCKKRVYIFLNGYSVKHILLFILVNTNHLEPSQMVPKFYSSKKYLQTKRMYVIICIKIIQKKR